MDSNPSGDVEVAPVWWVALVWWDPKSRTIMFDKNSNVPALMFFNADNVSVISPGRMILEASTNGVSTVWRGSLRCDLIVSATREAHRIYFTPPVRNAPRLSLSGIDKIRSVIEQSTEAGELTGGAVGTVAITGDYFAIGRLVTEIVRLDRAIPDICAGKANAEAFRRVLGTSRRNAES